MNQSAWWDKTSNEAHTISPGVTLQWLNEGNIAVYTVSTMDPLSIIIWGQTIVEIVQSWPKEQPYKAIHDLSIHGMSLHYFLINRRNLFNPAVTPEEFIRLKTILSGNPGFTIYLALVLSEAVSGQAATLLSERYSSEHPQIIAKSFFKREAAINWLNQPTIFRPE